MLYLSCQEILFFNHVQTEKRKASQRFPSPVGESYFSIMVNFYMMVYEHSFHPLSGNLIFQWNDKRGAETVSNWVSVPCRGILFFNMSLHTSIARGHGEFPSPVGESYFSIIAVLTTKQKRKMPVSVPCRGILFFNFHKLLSSWSIKFPSPIGESYFSMRWSNEVHISHIQFPSPIGESYFSMDTIGRYALWNHKFPSPVGESYFSIFTLTACKLVKKKVSVPCRGILFFNGRDNMTIYGEFVSVPYRGILFFNLNCNCYTFENAV